MFLQKKKTPNKNQFKKLSEKLYTLYSMNTTFNRNACHMQ